MKNRLSDALPSYFFAVYLLFAGANLLHVLQIDNFHWTTVLLLCGALIFYPFAEALAVLLPALLTLVCTSKKTGRSRDIAVWVLAVAFVFPAHLLLLFNAGLFHRYGYHINPHLINVFTTPGGFEAMGMRPNEIALLACGIAGLLLFHIALAWCFGNFKKLCFAGNWSISRNIRSFVPYIVLIAVEALAFLVSYFTFAFNHFIMNPHPLLAADAVPFYINGTSSSLFKSLGFKAANRDAVRLKLHSKGHLPNYPDVAIKRDLSRHKKYNVVWLTCESFAKRMYTPQIMPRTTEFAKKGVTFTYHYSGGNVTRQGVFSMFYALPASYWADFLSARRGPVFIDWLLADGYKINCITSSKFTYPEFDQTVFFAVPSKNMLSDAHGMTYQRDQRNVQRLLKIISDNADSGKPFFSFMFFESPHHPYEFPPEAVIFKDYINPFNAANVTPADGPAIVKRAANACHHLDICLGKIFDLLEKKDLLKNTIVVVAGDHGEEYFEKGYLGHSSKFNEEQTRTPLIIYYPGIKPGSYNKLSSHLDIVPMLAKFFGVLNDPADYSCGFDLLAPNAPERKYAVIANWDEVFFAGKKYKSLIPLDPVDFAKQRITTPDDKVLPDTDLFYREYNSELLKLQRDLTRFSR